MNYNPQSAAATAQLHRNEILWNEKIFWNIICIHNHFHGGIIINRFLFLALPQSCTDNLARWHRIKCCCASLYPFQPYACIFPFGRAMQKKTHEQRRDEIEKNKLSKQPPTSSTNICYTQHARVETAVSIWQRHTWKLLVYNIN